MEPSDLDIAWASGLFEGEGSIYYSPANDSWIASISMCDRDVVERFQAVFPSSFGRVHPDVKTNPAHADAWRTKAVGLKAELALTMMLPYLGHRRYAKALEALAAIRVKHHPLRCAECGTQFRKKRQGHRFCSARCRGANTARRFYHDTHPGARTYHKVRGGDSA